MEIIGEDLHIMNQPFLQAMENRDEEALVQLARRQVDGGATALDINLGRNRKLGRLTRPGWWKRYSRLWVSPSCSPAMS